MSTPSDDLQRLISASREARSPTPDDRARVARALALALGTTAAAGVAVTAASTAHAAAAGKGAGTALGTALATRLAMATVAVSMATGAGVYVHHRTVEADRARVSPAAMSQPAHRVPAGGGQVPTVQPHPVEAVTPAPVDANGGLQAQTAYLQDAQRALRDGHPDTALRTLDALGARYPHTVLREEQRAARVLALCGLGRVAEARTEAATLVRESPGSPLVARVQGSCAGR